LILSIAFYSFLTSRLWKRPRSRPSIYSRPVHSLNSTTSSVFTRCSRSLRTSDHYGYYSMLSPQAATFISLFSLTCFPSSFRSLLASSSLSQSILGTHTSFTDTESYGRGLGQASLYSWPTSQSTCPASSSYCRGTALKSPTSRTLVGERSLSQRST
jgi:hypothetical protein